MLGSRKARRNPRPCARAQRPIGSRRLAGAQVRDKERQMKRFVTALLLIIVVAAAAAAAQAPRGWRFRIDGSTNAADPDRPGSIQFMSMGTGFHAVTPQAAVFWNPANTASGTYTLKGTFTLLKPSSHTNYY